MSRRRLALLALVLLLAGCSGSGGDDRVGQPDPSPTTSSSSSSAFVLPVGKTDLTVGPGDVRSPDGFAPAMTLHLRDSWTSVHRDTDAFDLGQPDPKRDAPLVAVVVARPDGAVATALAAIGRAARRAGASTTSGHLPLAGTTAPYLDVRGGSGVLFTSADGTIALDAAPKQRLRAVATQLSGHALVTLVLVPDAKQWGSVWPDVRAMLASVRAS